MNKATRKRGFFNIVNADRGRVARRAVGSAGTRPARVLTQCPLRSGSPPFLFTQAVLGLLAPAVGKHLRTIALLHLEVHLVPAVGWFNGNRDGFHTLIL